MPRYYYLLDDVVHGPIEVQDLKRRFVSGQVDQSAAYVRREDRKDWVPASRLRFKSDPRSKRNESPFSLETDIELEDLVELEEIEEEAAEVPLDRVHEEGERPQPREKRVYALWSPSWSSFLSIFFTPAFGAYVHAKNWEILGNPEKVAINKLFFWLTGGALLLKIFFAFLSGVNPTFGRLAFIFGFSIGVLLIIWYVVVARSQTVYFNDRFPRGYRRLPWRSSWINVAGLVFLVHVAAQVYLEIKSGVVPMDVMIAASGRESGSLKNARQFAKSTFRGDVLPKTPPSPPPDNVFQLIKYGSSVGKLSAYVTPDPGDGKKHPAIIWITGGDCNSIDRVWEPATSDNDQTASAFRNAGIVMMFPSLRGGNDNPGQRECFLGEVDDVVSAAKYLAGVNYVDSNRIYLGGHSTGGTLALLVSEYTNRFRAVFAFGPAEDIRGYRQLFQGIGRLDVHGIKIRSPFYWLKDIQSPTFVMEGMNEGNIDSLRRMERENKNPRVHFLGVSGANHFDVLAPTNEFLAQKIILDTTPTCNISIDSGELAQRMNHSRMARQMADQHPAMNMPPGGFPPPGFPPNVPPSNATIPPSDSSPSPFPGVPQSSSPPPSARAPVQQPAKSASNRKSKETVTRPDEPSVEPMKPSPAPTSIASRPKGADVPSPTELFKPSTLSKDEQIKQMCDELNGLDKSNRSRMKELIDDLSKTKDKKAIRPIVRRVADAYPGAERALAPFGEEAEKVILDELNSAEDVEYIRRLADALGTVGTKESIAILRKLTKHESKFVRLSSESSLTEIRRRGF